MIPESFDWEDHRQDEWLAYLEALTEEETYDRGFSQAKIASANQRIRSSRRFKQ